MPPPLGPNHGAASIFSSLGFFAPFQYQTAPPITAASPTPPTMKPTLARLTALDASSNAESPGGAAHSWLDSEQFDGIFVIPRMPSVAPPATITAPRPIATLAPSG